MKKTKSPPAPKPKAMTDKEVADRNRAAIDRISSMDDLDGLRNLMANAERMGVPDVREAAFRRLIDVQVEGEEAEPGTLEHDFFHTLFAHEQLLLEDRGKATRLTKTRTRMTKTGAVKALETFDDTVIDDGFDALVLRGLSDITAPSVILRHPDAFEAETRDAATARLADAPSEPADPAPAEA